jgi:hypothetical protein
VPFLRSACLDTIRRLGRLTRAAPRNTTRSVVREHGARLKRVPCSIYKLYSSSAAASDGASPADGARLIDSHGTRDGDASTSPIGGAAGVPLRTPYRHAVLRIAAVFGPRTPHILRRSCAVSLQNEALKTAQSCFELGVQNCTKSPKKSSGIRRISAAFPQYTALFVVQF